MTIELSTAKYFSGVQATPEPLRKCSANWTFGIWVTCIVCCILGCYGIVDGGQVTYERATSGNQPPKRERGVTAEVYRYQKALTKFEAQNQTILVAHSGFKVVAGLVLLFGGVLMMWRSPTAGKAVMGACLLGILYHLSSAMLQVYEFASMKDYFEASGMQALRQAGVGGADRDRLLQHALGSMGFGHSLGVIVALAIPCLFYGRIMYFMIQPHVRETFAEDPYPEFREMEAEADALDAIHYAQTLREHLAPQEKAKQEKAAMKFDRV